MSVLSDDHQFVSIEIASILTVVLVALSIAITRRAERPRGFVNMIAFFLTAFGAVATVIFFLRPYSPASPSVAEVPIRSGAPIERQATPIAPPTVINFSSLVWALILLAPVGTPIMVWRRMKPDYWKSATFTWGLIILSPLTILMLAYGSRGLSQSLDLYETRSLRFVGTVTDQAHSVYLDDRLVIVLLDGKEIARQVTSRRGNDRTKGSFDIAVDLPYGLTLRDISERHTQHCCFKYSQLFFGDIVYSAFDLTEGSIRTFSIPSKREVFAVKAVQNAEPQK